MLARVASPFALGVLSAVLAACSSSSGSPATTTPPPAVDAGVDSPASPPPPDTAPGCNPILGDDCLTPFPSSFFEKPDSTTRTGVRMNVPPGLLPVQSNGKALVPDRVNQKDGVSPATPFLVYFKDKVDVASLPTWTDPGITLTAQSPVQIVDYATGERVLAFAEVDAHATRDEDRQALIIRPLVRLKPSTRYVVALVGLKSAAGAPLAPAPFVALRDGTPLSASLTPLKSTYDDIFAALEKAGVPRASLSLAWDVTTASDETATGHLVAMRDKGLAMLDSGALGYTVTQSADTTNDPDLLRQVLVDIQVPEYLADDSGTSTMTFGADGQPAMRGIGTANVVVNIPQCAKTAAGPLPVVVFGHGLFGTAKDTMSNATLKQVGNQFCEILIGTDWLGLAAGDLNTLPNILAADLNNFYVVSDRLQQAHVNAQVMTRMFLTKLKDDPAMAVGGKAITDGKTVYYFGVSDGGIQGTTFMGLSPDVVRGVLNVPGGEWSLLINRSVDFAKLQVFLTGALRDPLDQQVAIALTQPEWDYTDALTFAPHLLANPLPGTPAKRILVQESINDAQVTNVATRVLARTIGLPGLDLTVPVTGITAASAPLASAYTQWNSNPTDVPPLTNTALGSDNGAHDSVWRSTLAVSQIGAFLRPDGMVTSVCGGPCTIPR